MLLFDVRITKAFIAYIKTSKQNNTEINADSCISDPFNGDDVKFSYYYIDIFPACEILMI